MLALKALLALVTLGWGLALLKVVRRRLQPRWALVPEDEPCSPELLVSVIIPARNEEANIGACVASALAQDHERLEVIVLNDGSTDLTGDVLAGIQDPRLRVLTGGEELPDGWFGKPWALERAQREARGDWLFFIDADVRLHPSAVGRVVGYGEREGLGMVTGFGTLVMESFWEKVLQPAVAGIILMGNDLDAVNSADKEDKNMASGQLLAFSRQGYEQAGRHQAVKADILDDVGLARACVAAGVRYHCLFMRQLYRVRMYTSLAEIWEGWSKNLFAGVHYSWGTVVGVLVYLFLTTHLGLTVALLAVVGVLPEELLVWGLLQVGVMQIVRGVMDVIWEHNPVYGLSHAPATALVMAMMINSGLKTRGGGVSWKGRTYKPGA